MCKELNMPAEESLCDSLQVCKTVTTTRTNEHDVMPQAAPPPAALMELASSDPSAVGAPAAPNHYILQGRLSTSHDGQCEPKLLHTPIMASANHNCIDGSASVINNDIINPSLIPSNDADHTIPPTLGVCRPLQLQVLPHDHDHIELVALQYGYAEQKKSTTASWAKMQFPIKKLHARCDAEKEEEEEEEEEDGDQEEEEEEEGCATPTGRDQRIPQYTQELNTSGLVCPPAPKKKPSASKRRRLFSCADDGAANYHIAAERRAFLVDPPDLHNFPDCIRALFK